MRRNKHGARQSGPPARPAPKYLCLGGPKDGELLSIIDLPSGALLEPDGAGGLHIRRDHYVRVTRPEGDVWVWQELQR